MIDLTGKVALVTGAASGIGRASAQALARAGATVVVSDINVTDGQHTVAMITAAGGAATFIAADISRNADVDSLITQIVEKFGRLDCAHNNAGAESPPALVGNIAEADWDRSLNINLKGAWLCMRAELLQMHKQGHGVIVNTASVAGLCGTPSGGSYSAAKHGVIGLTRSAALDYAKLNIRINAVCPGLTRTGMTQRLETDRPEVIKMLLPPMGRMAEADEIGGVVAFLCSDLASFITGQAIAIDGGTTAI